LAINANSSDAESVAIWPASASSASDPDQRPATNSTKPNPSVSATAMVSVRPPAARDA
jgi:hypothetical protein